MYGSYCVKVFNVLRHNGHSKCMAFNVYPYNAKEEIEIKTGVGRQNSSGSWCILCDADLNKLYWIIY